MSADRYPLRVRLHGGRNTHGARTTAADTRITACSLWINATATNHWMPPTAVITCSACRRQIAREEAR
ncbi:hypothetical protein [Streptomyces sp. NPDC047315]|uniref:hypothetical protein n=1 Tax=Streptomyces sp. NPDC047315 TaxID=3155142 RepID=UPI0033CEDFC0